MENGSCVNLSCVGAWSHVDPVENSSGIHQSSSLVWNPVHPIAYYISGIFLHSLSVVLNLIIVVAFCCKRKLRTKPNVFIFSLAVSGVVHGSVGVVYTATSVEKYSHFLQDGAPRFGSYLYVWQSAMTCNYLNIVAVSIERWIFIARPILYRKYIGRKLIVRTALLIWLLSLVANLDQAIFPFTEDAHRNVLLGYRVKCLYVLPLAHTLWVVLVCSSYAHLVFIATKQLRSIHSQRIGTISEIVIRHRNNNDNDIKTKSTVTFSAPPPKPQAANPRRRLFNPNWRSVKMFVCMFGSFFLTLSPGVYYNVYTMTSKAGYQEASDGLNNFFVRLGDVHFCLIFFVYTQQNKDFRDTYRGVFRYIQCSGKTHSVSPACERVRERRRERLKV